MFREYEFTGSKKPGDKRARDIDSSVQALHEAASRLAEARRNAPRFKTRDLVGLLLTHGARTWRNSQPRVHVRVKAVTPGGRAAVKLSLGVI